MVFQSNNQENARFRVAICGGGPSGSCLAYLLAKHPHIKVDLYEGADQIKATGAGLMQWPRTWKILQLMGLGKEFTAVAHAPPDESLGIVFDYRRSDKPGPGFEFYLAQMPYGSIRFHRAQFLNIFVDRIPEGVVHLRKKLSSYSSEDPEGEITLYFEDGTVAACDILIGCDGIRSTVRSQMFTEAALEAGNDETRAELLNCARALWTGSIGFRGLIPIDRLPKSSDGKNHRAISTPMMYCGDSKHVVSYSISLGDIVNVVAYYSDWTKANTYYEGPWVEESSQEELLACYQDWEPEVKDMLKCIENPSRWAIHHLGSLPFYVKEKVALIGDAAHAMGPHMAAGAGQAIEDAFVLAFLLGHSSINRSNLPSALVAYEKIRLPLAERVRQESFRSGQMYEFVSEYGSDYERLGPAIERQWDWNWVTKPEEDCERALALMELMRAQSTHAVDLDRCHLHQEGELKNENDDGFRGDNIQ